MVPRNFNQAKEVNSGGRIQGNQSLRIFRRLRREVRRCRKGSRIGEDKEKAVNMNEGRPRAMEVSMSFDKLLELQRGVR